MPIYEYRCGGCNCKVEIFFRSFSGADSASCPNCGSTSLTRLISRVTVVKSWGGSLVSPGDMGEVDEDDPEAMQGWMRRIKEEMGVENPELDEMDLMDAGISPHDHDDDHGHDLDDLL